MAGKSRKTFALAASLALAGAGIFGSAASAQYDTGAGCWDRVMMQCGANWQFWGLSDSSDCAQKEACAVCQDTGTYNCPTIDYIDNDPLRHASHGH